MTKSNIVKEFKPGMEIRDIANGAVHEVINVSKRTGRTGKKFTIVTCKPMPGYPPLEFIADNCTTFEHVGAGHLQVVK